MRAIYTGESGSMFFGILIHIIFMAGSLFCFFFLFRKFHLKMLLSGMGTASAVTLFALLKIGAEYGDAAFLWKLLLPIVLILMIVCVVTLLVGLLMASMNPNLVIDIKTVGGGAPIQIRRKSLLEHNEYTGFDEVIPAAEAELAVREINAMINDIQNTGDRAIRRWQN